MSCTNCGDSVAGMKFCGSCGTKVTPGFCSDCGSELLLKANFCIECGSPVNRKAPQQPNPTEASSTLVAATPDVQPNTPIKEAEELAVPVPIPLSPNEAPPPVPETATPPTAADVARVKKHFSAPQAPKCNVCGKSVYETERANDSSGLVFHKDCFRCKTCKVYLNGRQRLMEPETGVSLKIANGQYLVAKESSHLGDKGDFFCDKHSIKARGSVVKAQDIDEKYRDDAELERVASLRKDQNAEARISMQVRVGDMLPQCARCGRPIDKGQRAITSGIEKMHESCPTQEESDKAVRPARWFVRRAPERCAGTLTCDRESKHPHTFLFELERESFIEALKKNGDESVVLRYLPDLQAHSALQRKLVVPSSDATRQFDFHIKDYLEFSFANPKKDLKIEEPLLNVAQQQLIVRKFYHSNGVLQTMEAAFKYDEATQLCSAVNVDLAFEMWPPEVAAEMNAQLDPLAHLKAQKD